MRASSTKLAHPSILIIVLLTVASCAGTKTKVASEWMSPDYTGGPMHKFLVVAVANNYLGRLTYEDRFAEALRAEGAEAVASYTILPQEGMITRQDLEAAVSGEHFDGVLVTRLLGIEEKTTVVPPSTEVVPSYRGGYGYYGYYGRSYEVVSHPGYTQTSEIARVETKLWNAANGQLAWGIVSETFDKKSTADGMKSVIEKLVKKLKEDGLLASPDA